jgi:4-aminobutyrate aminotransferase-like enzyme
MYDNVVRVLVPLDVTDGQLQAGLDILSAAFAEVMQSEASVVG